MLFIRYYTIVNPCSYVLNISQTSLFAFKHLHIFYILCTHVYTCVSQYTRGGSRLLLGVTSFFAVYPGRQSQAILLDTSICRHWDILPCPVCILKEKSRNRELGIKMTFKPSDGLYLQQRMLLFLVFVFLSLNYF